MTDGQQPQFRRVSYHRSIMYQPVTSTSSTEVRHLRDLAERNKSKPEEERWSFTLYLDNNDISGEFLALVHQVLKIAANLPSGKDAYLDWQERIDHI